MNTVDKKSVFIVTKPIQYFNACNIDDSNDKVCLIIDLFVNSEEISKKISKFSTQWYKVIFFEKMDDVYKWIIKDQQYIDNLYIDSDFGFKKNYFLSKLDAINIYVYEEGIGTYTKDLREIEVVNSEDNLFINLVSNISQSLIKIIYKAVGHENYLGGSKYTSGIYLYNIEKHRTIFPNCKKELHSFKYDFITQLSEFKDKELFWDNNVFEILKKTKGRKVVLYLTSWIYQNQVDGMLEQYSDYFKILKLHPHIKDNYDLMKNKYDFILKGSFLVELFISELLVYVEELIVIHHNSSAVLYFDNIKKLKSIVIS